MDIAQLKTFLQCAKQRSFSRASLALNLSQSAVSKRIASLESELDCRLFDRIGREIWLTEAGKTFLPHAANSVLTMENSINALRNLNQEVAGSLHLATSHHVATKRLPKLLKQFCQLYPAVQLTFGFMESEQACQAVISGDVELAVLTLPPQPIEGLQTWPIWRDPLHTVIARDHPALAECNATQLITQVPALLPGNKTFTRQIIDQALQAYSIKLGRGANFLDTLAMLVEIGLGWSVLPRSMLQDNLQEIQLPNIRMQRTLGVLSNQRRTLSNAGRQLINLLQQQADPDLLQGE